MWRCDWVGHEVAIKKLFKVLDLHADPATALDFQVGGTDGTDGTDGGAVRGLCVGCAWAVRGPWAGSG